jgi:hypothetical protein
VVQERAIQPILLEGAVGRFAESIVAALLAGRCHRIGFRRTVSSSESRLYFFHDICQGYGLLLSLQCQAAGRVYSGRCACPDPIQLKPNAQESIFVITGVPSQTLAVRNIFFGAAACRACSPPIRLAAGSGKAGHQ